MLHGAAESDGSREWCMRTGDRRESTRGIIPLWCVCAREGSAHARGTERVGAQRVDTPVVVLLCDARRPAYRTELAYACGGGVVAHATHASCGCDSVTEL